MWTTATVSSCNFIYKTLLNIYDGLFLRRQLTTYYFQEKLLSQIFDMVLNTEAVAQRCLVRKCSYKFRKIHRKKPVIESFKGETPTQVFSGKFWEICKITFCIENLQLLLLPIHLWTTKIVFTITMQMAIQHFIARRSKYSTE